MGTMLSKMTDAVGRFIPSKAQVKGAIRDFLDCWCGEEIDNLINRRAPPSNTQPAPAPDISLAALPARPVSGHLHPARAATPRPTSASVGRSPPIAFARNQMIPLLLEEDEHADWMIKHRYPPKLHTPRTNITAPASTRLNVRGVGPRSQQPRNTFTGYGPSQLRYYSIPPLSPAASRQPSPSLQTTAPREVPLAPPHEYEAPLIEVTLAQGPGPAEVQGNIEGDTIADNSPIAETFVTANEGSRRDDNSPLAESFASTADSFVTAKEDNDHSNTETIKGASGTIKESSADD